MRFSLTLLLFIILNATIAQVALVDSLQQILTETNSEYDRVNVLNQLSAAYSRISLERSEQFAAEALTLATQLGYDKGMGDAFNNQGVSYAIKGQYTSALELFIKALKLREEAGDKIGASKSTNNIAGIFLFQKEFDKAIEYSKQSLQLLADTKDKLATGNAYISLGMIYSEKNDSTQAFSYFHKARLLFHELNIKVKEGQSWLKISAEYRKNRQFDQALSACFHAKNLIDVKTDLFTAVELYRMIARVYSNMHKEKEALVYFHQALAIADQYNDNDGRIATRLNISEFFQEQKRYDSALFYFKEYSRLNSETFNREKANQLASLEKIFETDRKDQQLKLSQQKISEQYTIIITISILLVIISVLGFMLYRYSREKKKSNQELTALNNDISEKNEEIRQINDHLEEEVNLRTQKIQIQNQKLIEYSFFNAHKVRGPLARIMGLVMLTKASDSLEEIKDLHQKVHISALELDAVVKEINEKLDTGRTGTE